MQERLVPFLLHPNAAQQVGSTGEVSKPDPEENRVLGGTSLRSSRVPLISSLSCPLRDLPFSSLLLSKANSTSTGQLDKLVSPGLSGLTPESEEERSLPPQRVSTFRPRPYSMADSNKVRGGTSRRRWVRNVEHGLTFCLLTPQITSDLSSAPPSPTR